MARLIVTLAFWIGFVSVAAAALTSRKEAPTFGKAVPAVRAMAISPQALEQAAGGPRTEFAVTERTEVTLNGKPCKYEEVPADASIVRMQLAPDKKSVLKIHFRTGK